jgi:N-methylhydantoinase A/oxoprolinase/acetone carboxylase beta subunit
VGLTFACLVVKLKRQIKAGRPNNFTDLVLFLTTRIDASGAIKTPSAPHDPFESVVNGVAAICEKRGITPADVDVFLHGTTVTTNAVLEGKGANGGLLNENMFGLLRRISAQQGYDRRDFATRGFCGADPLHVKAVSRLMGLWPVVLSISPGVLCALGDATTRVRTKTHFIGTRKGVTQGTIRTILPRKRLGFSSEPRF